MDQVEKVRVNPGNFADRKSLKGEAYDEARWDEICERIDELLRAAGPRCSEHGVAMRIGTNHGSLSDRIVNRFGDTPAGMVESALEFVADLRGPRLPRHRPLDEGLQPEGDGPGLPAAAWSGSTASTGRTRCTSA